MRTVLAVAALALLLGGCGSSGPEGSTGPHVVVTTSILGDVVANLVGDSAYVEVLMPRGADPHDFGVSAKQAEALRAADVVVRNGLGLEAGLDDAVESAADDGATVLSATDFVETAPFGSSDDGHGTAASAAEHEDHDHEGDDPHVFTDPVRMATIARALAAALAEEIPELRTPDAERRADRYIAELDELHEDITATLEPIPPERRLLVTNHEVFGYFAARYGFEVLGAVVPGGSTLAEPSASELADLAQRLERNDVPAIFVETSASRRLAEALAAEGADVSLVELYSESLGEPGSDGATYIEMMRTNAQRIADALARRT